MVAAVRYLGPSAVARRLGVSVKALRLYEEHDLLRPGRTPAGWRAYGPDDVARAGEVASLRALGFSLAQVAQVLAGAGPGLGPALNAHRAGLASDLAQLRGRLERVEALSRVLERGEASPALDLPGLARRSPSPIVAFPLPWPWDGERFELHDMRALNYIVGPLGSGKTQLARALAAQLEGAVFLDLARVQEIVATRLRLDDDPALAARTAAAMDWLAKRGAHGGDALLALVAGLEAAGDRIVVVDLVEQGLDEPQQQAVAAWLRNRAPDAPPLFLMTRSSAILDARAATAPETAIFCPANHDPPFPVRLEPGAVGYEALTSCLGSPRARRRTEGMTAVMPRESGQAPARRDPGARQSPSG